MRIVAIGLGGAGSRIVDRLYAVDRKSSRIACVQGLAVDIDEENLRTLSNLPDSAKLCFPPPDPQLSVQEGPETLTGGIDISEIISKIQNFESSETDAIVIFLGLGGALTDIAPHIITGLRSATAEPIFGLVTLPCLAEGERRSAKAADGIDMLEPLLDGMILFDNETWYKKTAAVRKRILNHEKGFIEKLGLGKQEPELSPRMLTYRLLNDSIVRRISLILKAGEFRADGGIDLAEVVLDSGEVLNTMKGMGFITIGYAVEQTSSSPFGFLSQLRPKSAFDEENKKKASRIVELAKQAIYHEISTPCDMTSAHKALILVAGPTHELSMKGFMTVRKWIDRSIAGLETRSGDYPVINTKNVAIIVMLSGLENIPRVGELREIREYYRHPSARRVQDTDGERSAEIPSFQGQGMISDEMIVLPPTMKKVKPDEIPAHDRRSAPHPVSKTAERSLTDGVESHHTAVGAGIRTGSGSSDAPQGDITGTITLSQDIRPQPKHSRPTVTLQEPKVAAQSRSHALPEQDTNVTTKVPSPPLSHPAPRTVEGIPHPKPHMASSHETPRQKVERELERQRIIAAPERIKRSTTEKTNPGHIPAETTRSPPGASGSTDKGIAPTKSQLVRPLHHTETGQGSERKTIIIRKKNQAPDSPVQQAPVLPRQEKYTPSEEPPVPPQQSSPEREPQADSAGNSVDIKDTPFRAKDQVFEGKSVQKGAVPIPRDSVLLKANLHLGKKEPRTAPEEPGTTPEGNKPDAPNLHKSTAKPIKKNEERS